ncbi:hypothetical protein CDAR_88801 [Caerostris darwini]|uniref:Uncharacterized protein n=1 Tax=Caerostris darwini TaxID=1538125 RepID=A0AAV4RQS7_9ARAC|nr:hypothetical protein CDAR_88801 [Caerostris darwini]
MSANKMLGQQDPPFKFVIQTQILIRGEKREKDGGKRKHNDDCRARSSLRRRFRDDCQQDAWRSSPFRFILQTHVLIMINPHMESNSFKVSKTNIHETLKQLILWQNSIPLPLEGSMRRGTLETDPSSSHSDLEMTANKMLGRALHSNASFKHKS